MMLDYSYLMILHKGTAGYLDLFFGVLNFKQMMQRHPGLYIINRKVELKLFCGTEIV